MPYPSVLPGRAFRAPTPYSSRLLFDWAAADLSLTARTGQVGTFSRASSQAGVIVDVNGRPLNAPPAMPRFGLFSGITGLLMEPSKTQIHENSDVESDATGYVGNNATVTRDQTVAFAGQWSLKVVTTNVSGSGFYSNRRDGTRMLVTVGTGYTYSVWIYGIGSAIGKTMTPNIEWWNAATAGAQVGSSTGSTFTIQAGWNLVTVTGVAPATTVAATATFYTNAIEGVFTFWADVPQFEPIQSSVSPFYYTSQTQTATGSFGTSDDAITFPFPTVLQPLWMYVKYVDLGIGVGGGGGASGVIQLGNAFQNGWVLIDGGGGNIQGYYEPPGGTSTSQAAYTYVRGNIVEVVIQILLDGSTRTAFAVNGGNDVLAANGGVPSNGVLPFGNPGTQFNPALLRFARAASSFQPFAINRAKVGQGLLPGVSGNGSQLRVALARAA